MLLSRYSTFHKSLISSDKFTMRFLGRMCEDDNRTVMSQTLSGLLETCALNCDRLHELTPAMIKQKCKYFSIPQGETWRVQIIKECLEIMSGESEVSDFSSEDFRGLLDYLCTD